MGRRLRSLAGGTALALLAVVAACAGPAPATSVRATRSTAARPAAAVPVAVEPSLAGVVEVGPAERRRTGEGRLRAAVPIRNLSAGDVGLLVTIEFVDAHGNGCHDVTGARSLLLRAGVTEVISALSRQSSAAGVAVRVTRLTGARSPAVPR